MQDDTTDPKNLPADADDGYTLSDLCDLGGVSARTVRYYIQQGLLPAAPRSGPGARYAHTTLQRLQFIRACQEEGWPLARIRDDLERLTPDDLDAALRPRHTPSAPSPALIQASNPALDYLARLRGKSAPPSPSAHPAAPPPRPQTPPPPPQPEPPQPPTGLTRTTWERITIDPNLELHVRRPLSVADNRRLDRLLEAIEHIYAHDRTGLTRPPPHARPHTTDPRFPPPATTKEPTP